eukprot:5046176-Prymnesium_polylepis.2
MLSSTRAQSSSTWPNELATDEAAVARLQPAAEPSRFNLREKRSLAAPAGSAQAVYRRENPYETSSPYCAWLKLRSAFISSPASLGWDRRAASKLTR